MMTTRITHFTLLPKNVDYWDYYILCRLDDTSARVLQRMEYWDSTKANAVIHAEQINEQLMAIGEEPTQDVTRYVYKSQEELSWEMIGSCSPRTLPRVLNLLTDTLGYLAWRNNPLNTRDRTIQYEFQESIVQSHLDRLYSIVKHFYALGRRARPVLYAIEQLVADGVYIASMEKDEEGNWSEAVDEDVVRLSIPEVAKKLRSMHTLMHEEEQRAREDKKFKPSLPRFVRADLKKDEARGFGPSSDTPTRGGKEASTSASPPPDEHPGTDSPTRNNAGRNPQDCNMEDEEAQHGQSGTAHAIPVITSSVITDTDYPLEDEEEWTSTTPLLPPGAIAPVPPLHPPLEFPIANGTTNTENTDGMGPMSIRNTLPPEGQREVPPSPHPPGVQPPPDEANVSPSQVSLLDSPLVEPKMEGRWIHEKPVQYAEYKNGKRCRESIRVEQIKAAATIHKTNPELTLEQFKLVFDDWLLWWQGHGKGSFHVSDLLVKQKNKITRLDNALEQLEARKGKPHLRVVSSQAHQPSSVQRSLEAAAGQGFTVKSTMELALLPLAERKAYNDQLRTHLAQQRQASGQ